MLINRQCKFALFVCLQVSACSGRNRELSLACDSDNDLLLIWNGNGLHAKDTIANAIHKIKCKMCSRGARQIAGDL